MRLRDPLRRSQRPATAQQDPSTSPAPMAADQRPQRGPARSSVLVAVSSVRDDRAQPLISADPHAFFSIFRCCWCWSRCSAGAVHNGAAPAMIDSTVSQFPVQRGPHQGTSRSIEQRRQPAMGVATTLWAPSTWISACNTVDTVMGGASSESTASDRPRPALVRGHPRRGTSWRISNAGSSAGSAASRPSVGSAPPWWRSRWWLPAVSAMFVVLTPKPAVVAFPCEGAARHASVGLTVLQSVGAWFVERSKLAQPCVFAVVIGLLV